MIQLQEATRLSHSRVFGSPVYDECALHIWMCQQEDLFYFQPFYTVKRGTR